MIVNGLRQGRGVEDELRAESSKVQKLLKQIKVVEAEKDEALHELSSLQSRNSTLSKERDQFSDDFGYEQYLITFHSLESYCCIDHLLVLTPNYNHCWRKVI